MDDKETEKLLREFYSARELETKAALDEKDISKQVRALRTPGAINTRKIVDYIARRVAPEPLTPSGVPRAFPKSFAAEFDASVRSSKWQSLEDVAETKRLASIFEGCRDHRELLDHVSDFRGKTFYGPHIVFWLRIKVENLNFLYSDYPQERLTYFRSDHFPMVVLGLAHGFYDGYKVDGKGNLIRPRGKEIPDPERSMKDFPAISAA